jgi:hypothetical protein
VGKEERRECGQRKRGDEGLTEKEVEEVSYERGIGWGEQGGRLHLNLSHKYQNTWESIKPAASSYVYYLWCRSSDVDCL